MGQPAHLEKELLTNLIKSSTKMASRDSRPRCSSRQNFSLINHMEDELARDPGLVDGSHLGSTFFALSYNPTLGPALVLTLILALVPAPAPALPFLINCLNNL